MHAAAVMRSSRMIIAPSCSGVFGSNMFSISCDEISASTTVPDSMISPSFVDRSSTISAPIFLRDISLSALTISVTWRSICVLRWRFAGSNTRRASFDLPSCSSSLRSSGWNTMHITITPTEITCCSIQFSA